jgi:hypothetical protein
MSTVRFGEADMKISTVRLRDFKRFTDLTITAIPESARLVILLGSAGSNSSSTASDTILW